MSTRVQVKVTCVDVDVQRCGKWLWNGTYTCWKYVIEDNTQLISCKKDSEQNIFHANAWIIEAQDTLHCRNHYFGCVNSDYNVLFLYVTGNRFIGGRSTNNEKERFTVCMTISASGQILMTMIFWQDRKNLPNLIVRPGMAHSINRTGTLTYIMFFLHITLCLESPLSTLTYSSWKNTALMKAPVWRLVCVCVRVRVEYRRRHTALCIRTSSSRQFVLWFGRWVCGNTSCWSWCRRVVLWCGWWSCGTTSRCCESRRLLLLKPITILCAHFVWRVAMTCYTPSTNKLRIVHTSVCICIQAQNFADIHGLQQLLCALLCICICVSADVRVPVLMRSRVCNWKKSRRCGNEVAFAICHANSPCQCFVFHVHCTHTCN